MKRINWACLMTCLFFYQISQAKVIKDDHFTKDERFYSWEKACLFLTKRESPLIEYHSVNKLDCMGKVVDVGPFCDEREAANPYLSRAIVDKKKKQIICKSASRVILKWQCEGKNDKYCQDIDIGCFLLKEMLARRLKLVHKSLTDGKYLNCYFDTQKNNLELNL